MNGYINSEFLPEAAQYEAALLALYREYGEVGRRIVDGNDDAMLYHVDERLRLLHADIDLGRAALYQALWMAGYAPEDIESEIGRFKLSVEARAK